jgi:hypothetical protein
MKITLFLLAIACVFCNCNNPKSNTAPSNTADKAQSTVPDSSANYFPVSSFFKGEIYGIKNAGTTPLKKIIIGNKMDSAWVKMETIDSILAPFLSPVIDTANLKQTFIEKQFLDQTLNAFTFTYDPVDNPKNTFAFTHWDVYVDPDNQKVRRIFLSKKIDATTSQQLTWQAGKYCKIVTLMTSNGKTNKAKEETITWNFD